MQTVELAFERFGEPQTATPLLILHGFFASARNWRGMAKQLAEQRQVYVLDMRNHGISPHAAIMDYPSMAADVIAFMQQHDLQQADFLGHSMGGKIAMWLALNHSERVNKLLIADISPVSYSHSFDNTIQALRDLPLAELGNRKQAEEWLATAIADLGYRQFLLQNLVLENGVYRWRVNLEYFHNNAHYIVGFPDGSGLSPYSESVLFLSGEASSYIRRDAIYQWFPKAEIVELAGTGHWLHVDAPAVFLGLVEDELNSF